MLAFQLLDFEQFVIPVAFQVASDQTVTRVDSHKAPPGQVSLVLSALEAQLPLLVDLASAGF